MPLKFREISSLDQFRVCRYLTRGKAPDDPELAAILLDAGRGYQTKSRALAALLGWLPIVLGLSLIHSTLPGALNGQVEMVILVLLIVLGGVGNMLLNPWTRPKNVAKSMEASRRVVASRSWTTQGTAGTGAFYYQWKAQNVAAAVSGAASKLAFRFGLAGVALTVASSFGFCWLQDLSAIALGYILDRPMRLKLIGTLVLVAAGLIAMVHALTQGDLWVAGLGAFFSVSLFISYRRDKRSLERHP